MSVEALRGTLGPTKTVLGPDRRIIADTGGKPARKLIPRAIGGATDVVQSVEAGIVEPNYHLTVQDNSGR